MGTLRKHRSKKYKGGGVTIHPPPPDPNTKLQLQYPSCVKVDYLGNVFIADNTGLQMISASDGTITHIPVSNCYAIALDSSNTSANYTMYASDGSTIYKIINPVNNPVISTINNTPIIVGNNQMHITSLFINDSNNLYIAVRTPYSAPNPQSQLLLLNLTTGIRTTVTTINDPSYFINSVAVDTSGNIYISSNNYIRTISSNGTITTIAGQSTAGYSGDNGPSTSSQLNNPVGLALDSYNNIYVADMFNGAIRKISNGIITTVAGGGIIRSQDGEPATSANLYSPADVTIDSSGNIYIAENGANAIRKITGGIITTLKGHEGSAPPPPPPPTPPPTPIPPPAPTGSLALTSVTTTPAHWVVKKSVATSGLNSYKLVPYVGSTAKNPLYYTSAQLVAGVTILKSTITGVSSTNKLTVRAYGSSDATATAASVYSTSYIVNTNALSSGGSRKRKSYKNRTHKKKN